MSPILDSIGSVKGYGWGALTALPPSFESIASATTTAEQASVVFSSIPSTYTHLQLRWNAQVTAGFSNNNGIGMRFNSDTSSTYAYHTLAGDGTNASAGAVINSTIISRDIVPSTASTNIFGAGIVDIIDYQSTSKNKTIKAIAGYDQNNTSAGGGTTNGLIYLYSGLWRNTAAITSITITPQHTWGANSTFSLYGIKGA